MIEASQLKLIGIIGGTWAVPDVRSEPVIRLETWQVMRMESGDHHLLGWNGKAREGRVTSRIEAFDPVSRQAVTSSGRVYKLCGPAGHNVDAGYVWRSWLQRMGDLTAQDVTEAFVQRIEAACQ